MSKITKYLFAFVIFIAAFFSVSFFSFENLSDFSDRYAQAKIYHNEYQDQKDFCSSIEKNAEKNHISVFAWNCENGKLNDTIEIVYGTEGVQDKLLKQTGIHPGTFHFMFTEPIQIRFEPMKNLPDSYEDNIFYMIGKWEDISQFKKDLSNDYEVERLIKGTSDQNVLLSYGIWMIVYLVLLVFTLFEIISFEKEKTILVVNGKTISALIRKKALPDILFFSMEYLIAYFLVSRISVIEYHMKGIILSFLLFLIGNTACYLLMLRFDVKKGFANAANHSVMLSFMGITKTFITFSIIIALSLLKTSLGESLSFLKQNEFFQNNKNLNYVSFGGTPDFSSEETIVDYSLQLNRIQNSFYEKFQDKALIMNQFFTISNHPVMQMNTLAFEQFSENLRLVDKTINISDFIKENKKVVLIPRGLSQQSLTELKQIQFLDELNEPELEYLEYERFSTVCVGVDNDHVTSYENNPIVTLNFGAASTSQLLFYVSEDDVKDFLKSYSDSPEQQKFQWRYFVNNASELYDSYKAQIQQSAMVYSGIIILLFVMTIMTLTSFTKIYFIMHKREFVVKYCLGYHFVRILSVPFFMNLVILLISSVGVGIASAVLELNMFRDMLSGAALLFILDCLTLIFYYFSFIRKNIIQILKGKAI